MTYQTSDFIRGVLFSTFMQYSFGTAAIKDAFIWCKTRAFYYSSASSPIIELNDYLLSVSNIHKEELKINKFKSLTLVINNKPENRVLSRQLHSVLQRLATDFGPKWSIPALYVTVRTILGYDCVHPLQPGTLCFRQNGQFITDSNVADLSEYLPVAQRQTSAHYKE